MALIVLGTVCCKTIKPIVTETIKRETTLPDELSVMESRSKKDFTTLKLKRIEGNLIINGLSDNVKGNMAVYRDSLIVMSVIPALGYELIRILCTPDSVIVINRHEKNYIATSFDRYCEKYGIPLNFFDIQAIIYNEVFYYSDKIEERTYNNSINMDGDNPMYIIESLLKGKRISRQTLSFDAGNFNMQGISVLDYERRLRMDLTYSDFVYYGNINFPRKVELDMFENVNTIEINLKYGQVTFNEELKVEFDTPDNYSRTKI